MDFSSISPEQQAYFIQLAQMKMKMEMKKMFIPKIDRHAGFELYDEQVKNLNINPHLSKIMKLVQDNFLTVIEAPTGTGKSIALTMETAKMTEGQTFTTVPTVLAAKGLVKAIEHFSGQKNFAGLGIQGTANYSHDTPVVYMTTQHLVNKIFGCNDNEEELSMTLPATIIVDEVHTPDSQIWVLLCLLRKIFTTYPNLKDKKRIIVSSATLDQTTIGNLLEVLQPVNYVVEVHRQFETHKIIYDVHPFSYKETEAQLMKKMAEILTIVKDNIKIKKINEKYSNVLIFAPGKDEIDKIATFCEKKFYNWNVLALYGQMPDHEMERVLTENQWTIIISTPVANSSITLDVCTVIDTCFHKRMVSDLSGNSVLKLELAPLDCIKQREGRTGRKCPGLVFQFMTDKRNYKSHLTNEFFEIHEVRINTVIAFKNSKIGYDPEEILGFKNHFLLQGLYPAITTELSKIGLLMDNKLTKLGKQVSKIPTSYSVAILIINLHNKFIKEEINKKTFIAGIMFYSILQGGNIGQLWWIDRKVKQENNESPGCGILDQYLDDHFGQYKGFDDIETLINLVVGISNNSFDVICDIKEKNNREKWNFRKRCIMAKINSSILIKAFAIFRQIIKQLIKYNFKNEYEVFDFISNELPDTCDINFNSIRKIIVDLKQDHIYIKSSKTRYPTYVDNKGKSWSIDNQRSFNEIINQNPYEIIALNPFVYFNPYKQKTIRMLSVFVSVNMQETSYDDDESDDDYFFN